MHLAMASTVEAQTAEEAKSLPKTESCDRKSVIRSADFVNMGLGTRLDKAVFITVLNSHKNSNCRPTCTTSTDTNNDKLAQYHY